MIDLTPIEVRKKKEDFRRVLRGYDPEDVDVFLELVADRMEALVRENASYAEQVRRLEAGTAEYRERERALTEALIAAQEMREELRRQGAKDAELLRREAEAEAAQIRAAALQAREREEEGLRRIRARRAQLVQSYRMFLERELAELQVLSDTLDLAAEASPLETAVQLEALDLAEAEFRVSEPEVPEPEVPEEAPASEVGAAAATSPPVEEEREEEKKEEDYSEGLDWLSSLLKEEP